MHGTDWLFAWGGMSINRFEKFHFVMETYFLCIIAHFQSECIEKYQVELCSKYDREDDFDVILGYVVPCRTSQGGYAASI